MSSPFGSDASISTEQNEGDFLDDALNHAQAATPTPKAKGSSAGCNSDRSRPEGPEDPFEALPAPERQAEDPVSGDVEIEEVARTYPLPALDTLRLRYERTLAGTIKVHQQVRRKGKVHLVPVATPFGVLARLRFVDQADGFGLRILVQDMGGQTREIDVDRAAFGTTGASAVKALLFNAGLRTEKGGEHTVVHGLKAADPDTEIRIVKKPGWHQIEGLDDPVFVCPDGQVLGAGLMVWTPPTATTCQSEGVEDHSRRCP